MENLTNGNDPAVRPTKFAHVVYRTRRFEQMLDWYKTVFGAQVQYQAPALAFLTSDDEHHRFAIANMSVLKPDGDELERRGDIGVDHVAYTYSTIGDLLENYSRLKGLGIAPYWTVHHGISVSMYYADPDGNQMEFQVDCLNRGEAGAYMATAFAANPVGVEVDFDSLLTQHRNGVPAETLLVQPDGPPSPIPAQHGM